MFIQLLSRDCWLVWPHHDSVFSCIQFLLKAYVWGFMMVPCHSTVHSLIVGLFGNQHTHTHTYTAWSSHADILASSSTLETASIWSREGTRMDCTADFFHYHECALLRDCLLLVLEEESEGSSWHVSEKVYRSLVLEPHRTCVQ